MRAEEFIHGLNGVRKNGKGWSACCPAHDDRKASLHVSDGEKGVILKCFTGCDAKDIAAAKGLELKDLFFVQSSTKEWLSFPIKTVEGKLVAVRKRRGSGKKKELLWESPNGKPDLGGLKTCDLPLYGSEHIKTFDRSRWIELGEGEAKTQALQAIGAQALGTSTGASSTPSRQVLASLSGCKVRLWPDNDDAGRQHMSRIASELRELGIECITLNTRSLPPKGDAVQWREAMQQEGKSFAQMRALLDEGQPLPIEDNAAAIKKTLKVRTLGELLSMELPPLIPILGEWLTERSLSMIYSKRGTGKTWFCLEMAYAIASGGSFLKWKARDPRTVLYVDGEMPASTLIGRLGEIHKARSADFGERLRVLSFDDPENEEGIPDLCTKEGQSAIEEHLEGVSVLVLDNASCLFRSGDENEAQSWHAAQSWLMSLRRKGLAVLLVHHAGKSGQQRGTSRREDTLDYVIKLQAPEEAKATDGARFTVTFEKNRHYCGPEVQPFETQLTVDERGRACWTMQDVEANKRATIAELLQSGMKVNAIAREVGVSHGYVSQVKARLGTNGRQRGEPVSGYSPYEEGGVTTSGSEPKSKVTTNQRTNLSDLEGSVSSENHRLQLEVASNRGSNRSTNQPVTAGQKNGYYPPSSVTDLLTAPVTGCRGTNGVTDTDAAGVTPLSC